MLSNQYIIKSSISFYSDIDQRTFIHRIQNIGCINFIKLEHGAFELSLLTTTIHPGDLEELASLFKRYGVEIHSLKDLVDNGHNIEELLSSHHNQYPHTTINGKNFIECKQVCYYSPLDESQFFHWLESIGAIDATSGSLDSLFLKTNVEKLDKSSIHEIFSLFLRYNIDTELLKKFIIQHNLSSLEKFYTQLDEAHKDTLHALQSRAVPNIAIEIEPPSPGEPTQKDGYSGEKIQTLNPNLPTLGWFIRPKAPKYGWLDTHQRVWVPSGETECDILHWDVEEENGTRTNIYPKLDGPTRVNEKYTVTCKKTSFLSESDEQAFFDWIEKSEVIEEIFGSGDELYLELIGDDLHDHNLRELLALFYRYNIDMKQLARFLNDDNKRWFYDNKRAYWHNAIFGS